MVKIEFQQTCQADQGFCYNCDEERKGCRWNKGGIGDSWNTRRNGARWNSGKKDGRWNGCSDRKSDRSERISKIIRNCSKNYTRNQFNPNNFDMK